MRNNAFIALVLFLILAAIYSAVREQLVPRNADTARREILLTGDEPEYLLAAYSFGHDYDMNVRNQVEGESWKAFQSSPFAPWHGDINYFKRVSPAMAEVPAESWNGVQLLVHRPGISVLISPASFSEDNFRWWAYLIISIVSAVLASAILFLMLEAGIPATSGLLVSAMLLLSPPAFFYANQAYPEMPIGAMITVVVALLLNPTPARSLFAAILLCLLPWFSDRIILPAFLIGFSAVVTARGFLSKSAILSLAFLAALPLIEYYRFRFNLPYPIHHNPNVTPAISAIPLNLPRVLLDSNRGLIWLFPAIILFPAAIHAWWRGGTARLLCISAFLAVTTSILVIASFSDLTGGTAPSGRYFVVIQWLALPAFLMWLKHGMTTLQKALLLPLLLFGMAESALLYDHPNWWYREYHPLFAYESIQKDYFILPWLRDYEPANIAKAAGYALLFSLLGLIAIRENRKIQLPTSEKPAPAQTGGATPASMPHPEN